MQEATTVTTENHTIAATYTTDSFRKVRDPETKEVSVKRWVEERQVSVEVQVLNGRPFFRGAAL
jgi:hypothetical protein